METAKDDIVIWESDTKSHLLKVKKVLDIYKSNNVTLNRKICQIAEDELIFPGDRLTANELKPGNAKVKPIVEFKRPK